jgi:hypothetical protein
MISGHSATFLFCVESGYLENQLLLAVECLRRFGGGLADAPILVVTPRYGPSLTHATLQKLRDLDVTYVRRHARNPWNWYVYMNKALAAELGDSLAETEQIIWLDSDVLVVSEPTPLLLKTDEDFVCGALSKNIGSSGPGDPYEAYWEALSSHYGVPLDDLPWVETERDRRRVRFRLHSGVYSFRRGVGLGKAFVADMESMLASRVAFSSRMPYPGDDVALAYSVVRTNLRWRLLPMSCNYEMTPTSNHYRAEEARHAQVLHFHHALSSPTGAAWFCHELDGFRPDVAEWLRCRLPLGKRTGGLHRTITRRLLAELRAWRQARHRTSCQFMVREQ